jgi:hypothetical protein
VLVEVVDVGLEVVGVLSCEVDLVSHTLLIVFYLSRLSGIIFWVGNWDRQPGYGGLLRFCHGRICIFPYSRHYAFNLLILFSDEAF